jgi:peroxiredoxin
VAALRDFLGRRATIALEVLLVVAVFLGVSAYQTRKHLSGEPAPAFTLLDLEGRQVSLGAYRHKKVLLHFWATWCGVCRMELPSVRSFHRSLNEDEVLLTIVEDADDVDALRAFAREHALTYPILLGTRETLRAYRVSSFPTNYFVNGDGTVRTTTVGLSTRLGMSLRMLFTSAD